MCCGVHGLKSIRLVTVWSVPSVRHWAPIPKLSCSYFLYPHHSVFNIPKSKARGLQIQVPWPHGPSCPLHRRMQHPPAPAAKGVLVKGTELPAPDTTVAYWDGESWTKLEHSVSLQRHLRRLGCGFWNVDSLTATSFKWSTLWKSPAFTVISFTTLFKRVDGPKRATCRCLRFEAQGPFILEHKLPYGGQLLLSRVSLSSPPFTLLSRTGGAQYSTRHHTQITTFGGNRSATIAWSSWRAPTLQEDCMNTLIIHCQAPHHEQCDADREIPACGSPESSLGPSLQDCIL